MEAFCFAQRGLKKFNLAPPLNYFFYYRLAPLKNHFHEKHNHGSRDLEIVVNKEGGLPHSPLTVTTEIILQSRGSHSGSVEWEPESMFDFLVGPLSCLKVIRVEPYVLETEYMW